MPAFVEGERLIAWCFTSPGVDGGHQVVVITEPKSTLYFPRANAVRHRLPTTYDDEGEARAAALSYGNELVL